MKKRILSFVLILVMAIGFLPTIAFADVLATSGTCGENTTWSFDVDTGTLTISGTGDMDNFYEDYIGERNFTPWYSLKNDILSVTINNGVTSIGNWAFASCSNLITVTFPDSLKTIGSLAFLGCSSLVAIVIPDEVTTIGHAAFNSCSSLVSVKIGNGVTTIDDSTFSMCYSLASVIIGNSVKSINYFAFYNCSSLTSVTIPDSVKSIGAEVFFDCSNLESVKIGCGLTSVDMNAFSKCDNLKSVYINDISAWCSIDFSNPYANPLCYADNLYLNDKLVTEVTIPNTVVSIGRNVFSQYSNINSVIISDGVTNIGKGSFWECKNLSSVKIPNSVTSIDELAFYNCKDLRKVVLSSGMSIVERSFNSSGIKVIYIPKEIKLIKNGAFDDTDIDYVYYGGSESDKQNLTILQNNESLNNATWIYNAKGLPEHEYDNDYDDICNLCGTKRQALKDTSKTFKDIKSKAWYKYYVDYSVAHGIFTGTSKTTFSPNANITRAQFVQVLANLEGVDTSDRNVTTSFSDVPAKKWFTSAVKWASDNKIVNGVGDGKFDPNANVTREQMCVMLVNYAKFKGITLKTVEDKASFADDASISKWAKTAVYTCQQSDIVNGKGANTFDPQGTGTRADASVIFTKFHKEYLVK